MEKFFFSHVKVWVFLLVLIFGSIGAFAFSSLAVKGAQGEHRFGGLSQLAYRIVAAPDALKSFFVDGHITEDRFPDEVGGFTLAGSPVPNPQYLLLSRYDGNIGASVVELMREGERDSLHRWVFNDADDMRFESDNLFIMHPDRFRSYTRRVVHPYLTESGELFAHVHSGAMYKFDACSKVEWVNAEHEFHHSLEKGLDDTFWSVGTRSTDRVDYGFDETFREDVAIKISSTGKVLEVHSVLDMIIEAGMLNRAYDYDVYVRDPFHLNDIQPVLEDGDYLKRGDLLLSLGHLNMIIHYRPSSREIVWYSQDAMMHQHDIDVVDTDVIQLFDNRRKTHLSGRPMTIAHNRMLRFELPNKSAIPTYSDEMGRHDVNTISQGLADEIEGQGIMFEDTNSGRLVKLDPSGNLQWTYLNRSDDGRTWTLNWSRYIPSDRGDAAIAHLKDKKCDS